MKINLQTGLASHSAAAKSPAKLISFLQEVFKLKAPVAKTMADTLTQISKEKALVTPAIDAFLEFAKTAKQPDIEKAIKSKTVQNLKPVLASIVKNKTFAGTIAAVKNFKFKAPVSKPSTAKAPLASSTSKKDLVRSLNASANLKDMLKSLEGINSVCITEADGDDDAAYDEIAKLVSPFMRKLGLKDVRVEHEYGKDYQSVELYTDDLQVWIHPKMKTENVSIYQDEDDDVPVLKVKATTVRDLAAAIENAKALIKKSSKGTAPLMKPSKSNLMNKQLVPVKKYVAVKMSRSKMQAKYNAWMKEQGISDASSVEELLGERASEYKFSPAQVKWLRDYAKDWNNQGFNN